jgi:hypothetical protein
METAHDATVSYSNNNGEPKWNAHPMVPASIVLKDIKIPMPTK